MLLENCIIERGKLKKIKILLESLNRDFIDLFDFVEKELTEVKKNKSNNTEMFNEKQTVLITYADQLQSNKESHLQSLNKFLQNELDGICSHVHILPFYPWTSDDGFGPNNYHEVASDYGTWEDIKNIKAEKMFDCVFNHLSSQSDFFQKALKGDRFAERMFHVYSEDEFKTAEFQNNIDKVVRPRTTPLFTPFDFNGEKKYVWTTFSDDQVDVNLNDTEMMKYILKSFFLYIKNGAKYFRVDAVPFMWKKFGTNCSHLHKTHLVVQLLRAIAEEVGKDYLIITESNVPHFENISYFGAGDNEAHLVYNFSLAPLILHALTFKSAHWIVEWAKVVFDIPSQVSYLNFTATHDGIGMRGLEGLVPEVDVETMCEMTLKNNGKVGMKRSRSGEEKPYELNITWASFLETIEDDLDLLSKLIVNSHAIVMFYPGVPANYVHNFFGTRSWIEGREKTGVPRTVNRKKCEYPLDLNHEELSQMEELKNWIKIKTSSKAFHPKGKIQILEIDDRVISFKRSYNGDEKTVFFNLTKEEIEVDGTFLKAYDLIIK